MSSWSVREESYQHETETFSTALLPTRFSIFIGLIVSGIILEYEQSGVVKTRSLDLLDLTPKYVFRYQSFISFSSDTEEILQEICSREPLVTEKRKLQVFDLIERLKSKLANDDKTKFGSYKVGLR